MRQRHSPPLPRLWLMTDERMAEGLDAALLALPRGSGVIFRHYGLPLAERRSLLAHVTTIARRRRLTLLVGGSDHGRQRSATTASVHSLRERIAAERAGARLIFLSPVFATRSHPGARPLGRVRFGLIVRGSRVPVIALGGMTPARFRSLAAFRPYGWAAIDGLMPQKRKAVPT